MPLSSRGSVALILLAIGVGFSSLEGQPPIPRGMFQDRVNNLDVSIEELVLSHDWMAVSGRLIQGPELVGGEAPFRQQLSDFEEAFVQLLLSREVPPGRDWTLQAYHRALFSRVRSMAFGPYGPEGRSLPELRELLLRVSDRLLEAGEVESSIDAFRNMRFAIVDLQTEDQRLWAELETRVRQPNRRSLVTVRGMTGGFEWQFWEPMLRRLWEDRSDLPHLEEPLRRFARDRGWG